MSEWQLIETAPKDRVTEILIWFPYQPGLSVAGCIFHAVWGYAWLPDENDHAIAPSWCDPHDFEGLGDGFTLWQPLPEPPK